MAAASSIQPPGAHSLNPENAPFQDSDSPESRQDEDAASEGTSLRDLADLEPDEIERRLERTRRELSNRRKILIKNLPQDTTNQEVHEILKEYELKYCFVDRNKGTAFVTLLNGEQAQDAIRSLHQSAVRGRDISVQLQPTDALLCVANLPHTFTAQQFHELVRAYGNIERCFLVYSELTGHSKGYGFVEYMKKDSASRARSELLGRPLGGRALVVQWTDVNQLQQARHLHSRCLCVDRLPDDFGDSDELTQLFSDCYKPVFCQLAQDEGSAVRGFGVVEYERAEQAEAVLMEMDRVLVGGQELRLSLCCPGTSGRSTLAALIAAQGVMFSSRKGLLPEPSLAQLLNSMTNPAALHVLMRPYHTGKRGKFGRPPSLPFFRPPLTAALLQFGKVQQQSAMLGNGLVLQNLLHMQLAQQQLLHIKDKHICNVSSLLGDPSRLLLHKALGLRPPAPMALGKGLLGDSPTELGQEPLPASIQTGAAPYHCLQARPHLGAAAAGGGGGELNGACISDKQPAPPGTAPSAPAQGQGYPLGMSSPGLGHAPPPPPKPSMGQTGLHAMHNSAEISPPGTGPSASQTSLLGEPPKEVKLPSNPYLNLASVLPGMVLQAPGVGKAQGVYGSALPPSSQASTSLSSAAQYSTDSSSDYSQYSQGYTQEAMQQWYQLYQAQAQGYSSVTQDNQANEYSKEQAQTPPVSSYGDYSSYMQAVSQYYSQPPLTQPASPYQHRDPSKEVDVCKPLGVSLHTIGNGVVPPVLPTAAVLPAYGALPMMPGFLGTPHPAPAPVTHGHAHSHSHGHSHAHATDWNQYYYNQARGQKREYPQLPVQELVQEGGYVGQHSQGLGGQYADYFKKKRI